MTEAKGEIDMKIDPSRAKALSSAISSVAQRIEAVAGGKNVCHLIPSLPSLLPVGEKLMMIFGDR
jgi:hypothetical protein